MDPDPDSDPKQEMDLIKNHIKIRDALDIRPAGYPAG
jgi:hypothetical protein